MTGPPDDEVILEITRFGDVQRVAAVHAPTGTEVVVVAPVGAALSDVRLLALRKLQRALVSDSAGAEDRSPPPRPGKWV